MISYCNRWTRSWLTSFKNQRILMNQFFYLDKSLTYFFKQVSLTFWTKIGNFGHSVCAHLWQDLCTNGVAGIQFFTLLFLPSHFYAYSGVKLQWFFRQSLTAQCVEISSFLLWRNDHGILNCSLILIQEIFNYQFHQKTFHFKKKVLQFGFGVSYFVSTFLKSNCNDFN